MPEQIFYSILEKMKTSDISEGNMMRAPGITYKGKVFAFYYENAMCFKLGKSFDPESEGITNYTHLSPFKNKPAMKAWFIVGDIYKEKWELLAGLALQNIKSEMD